MVSSRPGPCEKENPGGNGLLKSWGKVKGRNTLRELCFKRPKRRSVRKMWLIFLMANDADYLSACLLAICVPYL